MQAACDAWCAGALTETRPYPYDAAQGPATDRGRPLGATALDGR
jgi:hypothetical protein